VASDPVVLRLIRVLTADAPRALKAIRQPVLPPVNGSGRWLVTGFPARMGRSSRWTATPRWQKATVFA
jgi:hypothetical protein